MAVTAKDIQPTNNELLQLELINQARKAPNAEAQRLNTTLNQGLPAGTLNDNPKQPLALNTKLVSASRTHSQWMLDTNTFSHTGVSGSSPKARMESAGYQFSGNWTSGENISWTGTTAPSIDLTASIKSQHDGLFRSPGHRKNLLNNNYREIGIGQILGAFSVTQSTSNQTTTYTTSMLTNKFARSGSHFFLTGVAMKASDTSAMYQPGNEYPEVILEVDGNRYAPYNNGHFSIALIPGTYSITAFAPSKNWQSTQTVTITNSNTKWDVYLTEDQLVWVDFMAK